MASAFGAEEGQDQPRRFSLSKQTQLSCRRAVPSACLLTQGEDALGSPSAPGRQQEVPVTRKRSIASAFWAEEKEEDQPHRLPLSI